MIWALQDAKNKFSELVERTFIEGPQTVTRHGKEAVVVISVDEYHKLASNKENIVDFMFRSPLIGIDLKLIRNKDDVIRGIEL